MKAGNFSKFMFMTVAGAAMMLMVTGCGNGRKVPENSLAFADVVYVEDGYPVTSGPGGYAGSSGAGSE